MTNETIKLHENGLTPHSCPLCQRFVIDASTDRSQATDSIHNFHISQDAISTEEDDEAPGTNVDENDSSGITDDEGTTNDEDEVMIEVFRISTSQMLHDAQAGCALAKLCVDGYGAARGDGNHDPIDGVSNRLMFVGCYRLYNGTVVVFLKDGDELVTSDEALSSDNRVLEYYTMTTDDDPAKDEIDARPINTDPASAETFSALLKVADACLSTHQGCSDAQSNYMPTRLLEIEAVEDAVPFIRLRETAQMEFSRYNALSYCWGGPQPLRLTQSTLIDLQKGIPFSSLPKTIRDAVTATTNLSVSYLWVDALCIIQDCQTDVAHEIAQMASIYGQAYVVLTASRAAAVSEGFLHRRETNMTAKCIKLPYKTRGGIMGSAYLFDADEWPINNPTDSRAWCLQESILGTRLIDFGNRQTRWRCLCTPIESAYRDGWWSGDGDEDLLPFDYADIPWSSEYQADESDWLRQWRILVEQYTLRQISFAHDKSIAISAVAQRFGEACGSRYIAGLWYDALPLDLLWSTGLSGYVTKRGEYTGPSWSWTAIPSPVFYTSTYGIKPNEVVLDVLDCQIKLENEVVPYGFVEEGILRVRGRSREVWWTIHKHWVDEDGGDGDFDFESMFKLPGVEGINGELGVLIDIDAREVEFEVENAEHHPVLLLEVARTKRETPPSASDAFKQFNRSSHDIGQQNQSNSGNNDVSEESFGQPRAGVATETQTSDLLDSGASDRSDLAVSLERESLSPPSSALGSCIAFATGLILRKLANGCYSRLGVFDVDESAKSRQGLENFHKLFDGCDSEVIAIQ